MSMNLVRDAGQVLEELVMVQGLATVVPHWEHLLKHLCNNDIEKLASKHLWKQGLCTLLYLQGLKTSLLWMKSV